MGQLNSILALKLQRQQLREQQAREDNMRADAATQGALDKLVNGQQQLAQQQLARDKISLDTLKEQQNMEIARQQQAIETQRWYAEQKTPEERAAELERDVQSAKLTKDKRVNYKKYKRSDLGGIILEDKRTRQIATASRRFGSGGAKVIRKRIKDITDAQSRTGSRGGRLEALAGTVVLPEIKKKVTKLGRMAAELEELSGRADGSFDRADLAKINGRMVEIKKEFGGIVPADDGSAAGAGITGAAGGHGVPATEDVQRVLNHMDDSTTP